MNKPDLGYATEVTLKRIIDVDTVEVEYKRSFKVRLKDIMGAESNTARGKLVEEKLKEFLHQGDRLTVFIPSRNADRLMDINSFDRIVGDIWLADGQHLGDLLVSKNLARRVNKGEKPKEGE